MTAAQQAEKHLEQLQQRLQNAGLEKELTAYIPPELTEAVRQVLRATGERRVGGFQRWRENVRAMRKAAEETRKLKAYTTGTTPLGADTHVERYVAHKAFPIFLQDIITNIPLRGSSLTVEGYRNVTGTPGTWTEGANKPSADRTHYRATSAGNYIAITETYSQRVLDFLSDAAVEMMTLDLLMRVESTIHTLIVANIIANALAFPAATYASTVPNATWADVVALMIKHDSYPAAMLSARVEAWIDTIVLPSTYWMLFPVSLKETTGARLYRDVREAFNADVQTTFHNITTAPANNLAIALRSELWYIALPDTIQIHAGRVVDAANEPNLYRITLEIPIAFGFTRRIEPTTTTGYAMTAHLVNDRNTINQP